MTFSAAADEVDPSSFKVGFITLHDENSTYDLNFINAAREACEELCSTCSAEPVQVIGSKFVIYRENKKLEKRIVLVK